MYSSSRFTNWSRFDPFSLEISGLRQTRPTLELDRGDVKVPIYVSPLHETFLRPVDAEDVAGVLSRVPEEFLQGLEGVHILGGTGKQAKSRLVRYGCYGRSTIYLHALKASRLSETWSRKPKPSVVEEYRRAGAEWVRDKAGWRLEFDEASLRQFYLYDVLLHELGHHVDDRVWTRPNRAAERYAEWFALEQARALKEATGGAG